MAENQHVRGVRPAEVRAVAAMLARAFETDPIANFIMPSAKRRPGGLRTFFRVQMERDLLPFGGVYTNEDHTGAAIWAPPGKPMARGLQAMKIVLPMLSHVAGRNMGRALQFLSLVEKMHPKEPHWYLATLGTDPDAQGRGVGSSILQPVLARCDETGARAYLESSKEKNIPFYERHGFAVSDEVQLGQGPPLWLMWRDPRPPES